MADTSTSTVDPNGALDPLAASLVREAAAGSLEAQRRIRQAWFDTFSPDRPIGPNADLMGATGLFVARMCAANGDKSDADMLAVLLLQAGIRYHDTGRAGLGNELIAESLALFERLAATGDAEAADTVDKLVPRMPPELVARAQLYARPRKEQTDVSSDPQP